MNRLLAALGAGALAVVGSPAAIALAAPILHYYAPIFNASGQQVGNVNFVPQDQGGTEMVLTTNGLPPGRYNVVMSDRSGCPSQMATTPQLGQASVDLGTLRVDSAGNGAVTAYVSTLSAPDALVGHTVLIGRNLATANGTPVSPVACGTVGNS
jgi:hypothetical protein